MLVRELMTSPAVIVGPDAEVAEAVRTLDRLSVTSLPVVDADRRLLGIINEGDVIDQLTLRQGRTGGAHRRDDRPRVRDVMTRSVIAAQADDDVSDVVALMSGTTIKSVPVLLHERVVGVLSRRDVIRAMTRGDFDARTADELPPA